MSRKPGILFSIPYGKILHNLGVRDKYRATLPSDIQSWWFNAVLPAPDKNQITKTDLLEALRSGEPVPPEVAAFAADVIEGKHHFKRGPQKKSPRLLRQYVMRADFEQLKSTLKENGANDPRGEALEVLGERHGITAHAIEKIIYPRKR